MKTANNGLLDYIKNEIIFVEPTKICFDLMRNINETHYIYVPRHLEQNSLTIISEPILCLKLNEDIEIFEIFSLIDEIKFTKHGELLDRLNSDQLNIMQHKYNLLPKQYGKIIMYPLPFDCLLKCNGLLYSKKNTNSYCFSLNLASTKYNSNIIDACIYLNYTRIEENVNFTSLTKFNYDLISKTNSVKIPTDSAKIFKCNFNQCEKIKITSQHSTRCNLNFNYDVKSLYVQLNYLDETNTTNTYKSKWFCDLIVSVNHYEVLTYSYEQLCMYNNGKNLPKGVLEIPHIEHIDWQNNNVNLIFKGIISNFTDQTIVCCSESTNYFVCDSLYKNNLYCDCLAFNTSTNSNILTKSNTPNNTNALAKLNEKIEIILRCPTQSKTT